MIIFYKLFVIHFILYVTEFLNENCVHKIIGILEFCILLNLENFMAEKLIAQNVFLLRV